MLLLEQDTTKKRRVDKKVKQIEFNAGDSSGKYELETIQDSTVYTKESESGHLPSLHYLALWKGYPKEKNT